MQGLLRIHICKLWYLENRNDMIKILLIFAFYEESDISKIRDNVLFDFSMSISRVYL